MKYRNNSRICSITNNASTKVSTIMCNRNKFQNGTGQFPFKIINADEIIHLSYNLLYTSFRSHDFSLLNEKIIDR